MSAAPTVLRSLDEWACIVRSDLTGALEGLVAAGRHLHEAKAEHPGTFVAWLDSGACGFGRSHAYRLMSGSEAVSLIEGNRRDALPADSNALAELARLDTPQLSAAIDAGEVTPAMGRKEAKALVARCRIPVRPNLRVVSPIEDAPGIETAPSTFSAIVIDPPWQYDNKATRGAAEDHYPTMSLDQLEALDVPAADNAHLYLWVTNGFLRQGFDLIDVWGFAYKTCLTWIKPQIGMGNYFRNNTEHVLFAIRGTLATRRNDVPTWFRADRTQHSAKPECFYDLVEACSPGPYMEMFARRRRMGWNTWGNEA